MKPRNLNIKNNELYLHKYKLSDLVKKYHTPLYVYDEEELHYQMKLYKNNFISKKFKTDIVYASKAFLTPYMCDIVNQESLMIDAVSYGDLFIINKAGYPMEHVVFHGNNKSIEELKFAIEHNVGLIVVDNLYELQVLNELANQYDKKINTLFRVNPGIDTHTHKYIQTALYVSKFGESIYDEAMIDKIIKLYKESHNVILKGFHSHIGSQINDTKPFILNIDKMISFTSNIEKKYQIKLPYLNLGGGFGIQYQEDNKELNVPFLLNKMIKRLEHQCLENDYHLERVFIEPGRSIVGTAGITLYECGIIKKTIGGKNYLFVDGGMTDNIRPALYQAMYSVDVANRINDEKVIKVDVAGKCCESGDVIAHDVMIPNTSINDTLVVYATGAYTYAMASNYNSMMRPMVIMISDKVKVASKKENILDFYNKI